MNDIHSRVLNLKRLWIFTRELDCESWRNNPCSVIEGNQYRRFHYERRIQ
jgi:hypothetical protein